MSERISIFAPAKINLFLAITGQRPDGFHNLVSVAAPLDFGDILEFEPADGFMLTCDDAAVPTDGTNLVLKAATAFASAAELKGHPVKGTKILLKKRIPMGAGLGGGSSDAVATLRALNRLTSHPLAAETLTTIAAQLGSDCPLFL